MKQLILTDFLRVLVIYFIAISHIMHGHDDRKRPKISLASNDQKHPNLELEHQLVRMAINKSYIKQLARSQQTLNVEDTNQTVSNFLIGFIPKADILKELEEHWCIVALNEEALFRFRESSSFCSSGNNISSSYVDPKQLKLYQLFIGLGYRQFRLQSLSQAKKSFFFNADTIETAFIYNDLNQSNINNRIRIIIENKYDIDFYINQSTLSFETTSLNSPQETQRLCAHIADSTAKVIKASIQACKGKLYKLPSKELPDKDEFYNNRYATEQQFTKYCETGDVLLFRDNHTFAKVQRFLTNSECDHIGMVFKDEKYGLCIFESNSGTGVSLAMWNQLIRYKWFQNIEGIYWRRLDMQNKPQNFDERVKEFVKTNLHKEYGFSLGKLLRFNEIVCENEQEEKNRTYFCSELIAALYKQLGLFEPKKPSSSYIPKDFTDKGSLNMINNTALEPERRIIFNEKLLKESYRFFK